MNDPKNIAPTFNHPDFKEPRPKKGEKHYLAAAKKLFDDSIKQWLEDDGDKIETEAEELQAIQQIAKVISRSDGYEICRALEYEGWSPDSGLVEIMDGAVWAVSKALEEDVSRWVLENKITPAFKEGDEVIYKGGDEVIYKGERCTITRLYEASAKYVLWVPSNHPGKREEKIRTRCGTIVNFEDVEAPEAQHNR